MIDWCISPDFERPKDRGWFFPSFEIQELLIPQINPGKTLVDEYGATEFTTEDCRRIKGNIDYLIESGIYERRESVNFDAFGKGVVRLSCQEIMTCLMKLHEAADIAEKRNGILRFLGD
jgi:hypothetical protein